MAESGVQEIIGRKVAGLPLWAWAGGAGLLVLVISRRRGASTPPADTATPAETGYDQSLPSTGGTAPSSTVTPQSQTQPSSNLFAYSDNQEWRTAAFRALTSRGYDAVAVDQALTAYLASSPLTQTQASMIGTVLTIIGPTPQPVVLIVSPAPTAPASPTTPGGQTPPAAPGEKRPPLVLKEPLPYPYSLVRQVYGKVNKGMLQRFAAANGLNFDGNLITPWRAGMTVIFPGEL